MNFATKLFFITTIFILFLLTPLSLNIFNLDTTITEAAELFFSDEFNTSVIDTTKWQVFQNGGSVTQNGGFIHLNAGFTPHFPYVASKVNPFPTNGDFTFETAIQYTNVTFWGTGLALGTQTPVNGGTDFSGLLSIWVWQDTTVGNQGFRIQFGNNQNVIYSELTPDFNYNRVKIVYSQQRYQVFLNNNLIFTSGQIATRPNVIWFGNPTRQPHAPPWGWTQFKLDYIRVERTSNILPVPYFNQTSSPWGSQEYDHANSIGPFKCGRTIGQCGCAITSAAMLLKYYGIDKTPEGLLTNPETLNNWLKNNKGYINGDLDWNAIARYSKITHDKFGSKIIDYLGPVRSTNFALLNNDLSASKPVILEEKSQVGLHFIVATGIIGSTYSINDPLSVGNTTLNSYGNSFRAMRRYAPANTNLSALIIVTDAPNNFLVVDQQGRRTGRDPITGNFYDEIPNASYYLQEPLANDLGPTEPLQEGEGHMVFESTDTESGQYTVLASTNSSGGIIFRAYDQDAEVSEQTLQVSNSASYLINYSSEPGSQIEVTQIVDIDIKPGNDKNVIELEEEDDEDGDEDDGKGIRVAVLTTPGFDAKTVDVSTVRFGPGLAQEKHDINKKNFEKQHLKDVDKDGDLDLILHFKIKDTGFKLGDTQACLKGKIITGNSFRGCDSIKVVAGEDEDEEND